MARLDWAKAKRTANASLERAQVAHDRYRMPTLHHGGNCPKCGKATVERIRRSDGTTFFGCIGYPRCNGVWKPPPRD